MAMEARVFIRRCYLLLAISIITSASCKKVYSPDAISNSVSALVVEGFINISDSTFIKLSRTVKLSEGTGTSPVTTAQVAIESDNNTVYALQNAGKGNYHTGVLNLNATSKYRLKITIGSEVYVSEFVEAKVTPAIDKVGYKVMANGVQLYVNTHDDQNNTRFYRWEFEETWRFHADYVPQFKVTATAILPLGAEPSPYPYYCFIGPITSTDITLGSTAKLQDDVLFENPIMFIPSSSEKLQLRYSMLVKQYALTKEAFEYWENLKKNTENLGSIFDPQPSQVSSNIRNVNKPDEIVIGFISAGTVSKQRIYVSKTELPEQWRSYNGLDCNLIDVELRSASAIFIEQRSLLPVYLIAGTDGTEAYYQGSFPVCVDCSLRGKVNPPPFWINN